jgi:hypothetical protein
MGWWKRWASAAGTRGRIERGGGSEAGIEGGKSESTLAGTGDPQIWQPARVLPPPARLLAQFAASSWQGPRRGSAGGSCGHRVEGVRLRGDRGSGCRVEAPSRSREAAGSAGAGKREWRP